MHQDTLIVLGLFGIAASAFPLLNGFSRGEMPRSWAVMALAGFSLVAVVMAANPQTYTVETIPAVVGKVISDFL